MVELRETMKGLVDGIGNLTSLDRASAPVSEVIGTATRPDAVKNLLSGTWLGHQLHPVLTDLPIGAWVMASALDASAGPGAEQAAQRLVGLGVLAVVPTAASGASDWVDTYGAEQRIGLVHALTNVTATVLQTGSWLARRRGRHEAGVALSAIGLGIALGSSYLGGHLTLVRGVGVNHTAFQPAVTKWTDVAAVSELQADTPIRVSAGKVPVMLVLHDGAIRALSATCVHAGGPLDKGTLVNDGCIRCPWHASTFRLADGAVVRGPASIDQPVWEVQIVDERVLVRSSE